MSIDSRFSNNAIENKRLSIVSEFFIVLSLFLSLSLDISVFIIPYFYGKRHSFTTFSPLAGVLPAEISR